jgi:hypothetical protein
VKTTGLGTAGIVGADLGVVTVQSIGSRLALGGGTNVAHGARISIVTRFAVRGEETTRVRVTGVVRTEVVIAAAQFFPRLTLAVETGIAGGASVCIIAGSNVEGVLATVTGVAEIGGAGIIVTATDQTPSGAPTLAAFVAVGADIAIITRGNVRDKLATGVGVTFVICVEVAIVAYQVTAAGTLTEGALVGSGAQITIVTGGRVEQMDTSGPGVTGIIGAEVFIVTREGISRRAYSVLAPITHGAGVAVVAGGEIGRMLTSDIRIAGIIGTEIPVVTLQ